MKALTLHQPWASLIAVGLKTIETRSWSTKYRGPLAIHAGKRNMDMEGLKLWWHNQDALAPQMDAASWQTLPFGKVVATCQLTDVVAMVSSGEEGAIRTLDVDPNGQLWVVEPEWFTPGDVDEKEPIALACEVTDQRPYGDFAPGRFAWLLADIVPLRRPIPATGRQQLWEWREFDYKAAGEA